MTGRSTGDEARRVVVPCGTGGHRVRLGGGLRFWRSARCPKCRSEVDPLRWRRVLGWVRSRGRPVSDDWRHRGLWWGTVGFLVLVVIVALLLWTLGDVWWPVTAFLFGPRWVLALPLAGLLPAAVLWDRSLVLPLGLAALILAGPVIDLRTGWRSLLVRPDPTADIRIVTYNVAGGEGLASTAAGMAQRWDAHLLLFQECGGQLKDQIRDTARPTMDPHDRDSEASMHDHAASGGAEGFERPTWFGDVRARLCILSRFPIRTVEEMDRAALEAAGGSGQVATYEIDLDGTDIQVTNLHLETPRGGFELLRSGRVLQSISLIREKSFLRGIELAQARRWADRTTGVPRVVAGDFNTPPESRAYRASWSEWTNTYSRVGRGYGGTRLNGWIRPRIDHVLVDRRWRVVRAEVGEDLGSDHLPVIATVRLREGSR